MILDRGVITSYRVTDLMYSLLHLFMAISNIPHPISASKISCRTRLQTTISHRLYLLISSLLNHPPMYRHKWTPNLHEEVSSLRSLQLCLRSQDERALLEVLLSPAAVGLVGRGGRQQGFQYSESQRKDTKEVRQKGACFRCFMMRVRVRYCHESSRLPILTNYSAHQTGLPATPVKRHSEDDAAGICPARATSKIFNTTCFQVCKIFSHYQSTSFVSLVACP